MRRLWPLLIGLGVWATAFVTLYTLQALGCLWSWPQDVHRGILVTLWLLILGGLAALLFWQFRLPSADPIFRLTGLMLTSVAIAATALCFFPMLFVSLCL